MRQPGWAENLRRVKNEDEPEFIPEEEFYRHMTEWFQDRSTKQEHVALTCCGNECLIDEARVVPLTYCVSVAGLPEGTFVSGWFTEYHIVGPCCIDKFHAGGEKREQPDKIENIHRAFGSGEPDGSGSPAAEDAKSGPDGEPLESGGGGSFETSV